MRQVPSVRHFVRQGTAVAVSTSVLCGLTALATPARAASDPTRFSLEQLLSLTVVGAAKYEQSQSEVAAAASVITREEIQAFGWRTLADALASLPGIHTTYDRQYQYLGTRGFGLPGDYNTRVLVTINGNRVNDPVYDQAPIGMDFPLDLSLVERIELIPGPGSAVYGQNAMFGVVNVVTRRGADIQGGEARVGWNVKSHGSDAAVTLGRKLDDGAELVLSVSALNAQGQDLPMGYGATGVSGMATGMDGEHVQRWFAQYSQDRWTLDLVHGQRVKADPTGSYLSDPLVAGQFSQDDYTLANVQFQDRSWGDALQLDGRLFAGSYRYSSLSSYGTPVDMPAQGDWQGAELRLLSTALTQHKLMGGLEYQDNVRVDQQVLDLAVPQNNVSIGRKVQRTGLYLQDEWTLTKRLDAVLGVRWDTVGNGRTKSSPRIGLVWQPTVSTTVKALYGRAYRSPNAFEKDFFDRVAQVANPALRGESMDTTELVVDHRIDAQTSVRASLYDWRLNDLIVLGVDPASGLAQYQSGSQVDAEGLELSFDRTWGNGSRMRGSWSVQQVVQANGLPLVNSPARMLKWVATTPLGATGATIAFEFYGESSRLTLDGSRLGGYGVSSLFLRWAPAASRWSLGAGIGNLFDKSYAQPAADTNWQNALAQDGRSLRVEASYRF